MLIGNYKTFLKKFIDANYKFIKFNELDINDNRQIILRHDVDISIDLALKMAHIENDLNVSSTYFFLLTNDSYNLLCDKNIAQVKKIKDLGHEISLHFDLSIYNNPKSGFILEMEIFNKVFDEKIYITSIHRPKKVFLNKPDQYFIIPNTYEKKLNENAKYFADSGGHFRFGNPIDSEEFILGKNIQLGIHPVWWIESEKNVSKTIEKVLKYKSINYRNHIKNTIKTFK
ncbi:MAG: hypothetical protein CBD97_01395 [Pelagibacteraceae bacterium TMED237]|nr:MAG: hypothetical protein CBD97_01395 [Pelagibacteraceae bacterium TMED237]|tara:strand:+ start:24514 stop:25200 length:687 start_codon:yes stop_codon:yes gene_type:complete